MSSRTSRSGCGRLGRIAGSAVAALALAAGIGMSTAATADANEDGWGDTPGTYTHHTFPAGTPDLSSVTWSTTVTADPGFTSHTFWSHRFGFNQGNGGYIGMQDNGGEDQLFLFSIWDVNQANPAAKAAGARTSAARAPTTGLQPGGDANLNTALTSAVGTDSRCPPQLGSERPVPLLDVLLDDAERNAVDGSGKVGAGRTTGVASVSSGGRGRKTPGGACAS